MRKMILVAVALSLTALASGGAYAQNTEKKEAEKTPTTTVDAWRDALPQSEQSSEFPPVVAMDESRDNVETRETPAEVEKRILDLERRLTVAFKVRDSAALKHLLADGFTTAGVNITEAQSDKTRFIEWAVKNLELKSYVAEKTTVQVYPSTVVVTVRYKRQAKIAGSPADGDFIATNVWVRRGKLWQAVSQHVSRLSKP